MEGLLVGDSQLGTGGAPFGAVDLDPAAAGALVLAVASAAVFGWMASSFQTRRAPQFMRAGSWYPENEK